MDHLYVIKNNFTYFRFLKVTLANCAFNCVGTILSQHVLISSSALCPLCLFQKSRWQNYYKLCPYSNHWNTVMSRSNWQIWRPTILGSFGKCGSITANNRNVPLLKVQGPPGPNFWEALRAWLLALCLCMAVTHFKDVTAIHISLR